jgi:plastocyanin
MEYVHTVLAQIAANKVGEAEPLFRDLEAHRQVASTLRGYQGMRISRTAHAEGNVLLVVETRWSSNNAMVDYSTGRESAGTIIEQHADVTVPGSLQSHRLESVAGGEGGEAPNRMYDRVALALFVPVGVLAFALVVIYAMSRVYLSIPNWGASVTAIGAAIAILGLSFYFASNPSIPRWQWLGVAVASVAAIGVGGTVGAFWDEEHKEVHVEPTPAPPTDGTPAPPGELKITMGDNTFDPTELSVTAGEEATIQLENTGTAIHNVHVAVTGSYAVNICKTGDEGCSDPGSIRGGQSGTITLNLAAGTYDFRCDFHPVEMTGTITAQ